jgi:hypothetical protein
MLEVVVSNFDVLFGLACVLVSVALLAAACMVLLAGGLIGCVTPLLLLSVLRRVLGRGARTGRRSRPTPQPRQPLGPGDPSDVLGMLRQAPGHTFGHPPTVNRSPDRFSN